MIPSLKIDDRRGWMLNGVRLPMHDFRIEHLGLKNTVRFKLHRNRALCNSAGSFSAMRHGLIGNGLCRMLDEDVVLRVVR